MNSYQIAMSIDEKTQNDTSSYSALSREDIRSILTGVLLAMFLSSLDQTIISTAMPTIGLELHDFEHLSWVVTIYLLTSTAVTPLYGKLADIRGRRFTILVALGTFILGSIVCALASNMFTLILARGIQGLGGGGLIALGQTIIGDMIPPNERARYQAYFAIVFATSSLLGPILGGFFAQYLHWSIIFWINVPLGAVAFFISNNRLKKLPRHDRPHKLDLIGAFLMMGATILLLLALNWGGSRFAWNSYEIIALFIASLVAWLLFAARLRMAHEPLIPPEVLQDQVVRMGVLSAGCGIGTYIGLTIYLPIFFEATRGLSASDSGLALIPLMIGAVVGAQVSGRTMSQQVHYKRFSLVGLFLSMACSLLLTLYASTMPFLMLELLLGIIAAGLGTLFPVSTIAIQNAVALHQLGTVTATSNFFRSLGGALIVALFGAIVLSGGVMSPGASGEGSFTGNTEAAIIAFQYIFGAAFIGFGLSFLFLLLMEERPLKGRTEVPLCSQKSDLV